MGRISGVQGNSPVKLGLKAKPRGLVVSLCHGFTGTLSLVSRGRKTSVRVALKKGVADIISGFARPTGVWRKTNHYRVQRWSRSHAHELQSLRNLFHEGGHGGEPGKYPAVQRHVKADQGEVLERASHWSEPWYIRSRRS